MLRKGYVEQQIDALGLLMGRLFKLKGEGDYKTVEVELRDGCSRLTGLDLNTVLTLPEDTLLMMLGGGVRVRDFLEVGKCVVLASFLHEQAGLFRLERRESAALAAEKRSLMLLCEAVLHEPSLRKDPYRGRLETLAVALRHANALTPPLWHRLFRSYEELGLFGKAEDALYALREGGSDVPGLRDEAIGFYERLLMLPDALLEAGNLPRVEVADALAGLRREG